MKHGPQYTGPHCRITYDNHPLDNYVEPCWRVQMPDNNNHLYWVTVVARHNTDTARKRFAGMPVWSDCPAQAAREPNVLYAMYRLLFDLDPNQWWEEVRVYLANEDGAEGLPAHLIAFDGTDVAEMDGAQ